MIRASYFVKAITEWKAIDSTKKTFTTTDSIIKVETGFAITIIAAEKNSIVIDLTKTTAVLGLKYRY